MEQINESFVITDAAANRIAKLLIGEPEGSAFIVEILGGGCSGFQYNFDLKAKPPEPGNILIEKLGARVLVDVDEDSLPIVKGSTLDYRDDLSGAGFEIKNPNAKMSCGCGNSFSVSL